MNIHRTKLIQRGDIYIANLSPVTGSEQGGIRPVLIIQNNTGNRHSPTLIAAAITGHFKGKYQPTHVRLKGAACGLFQDSTVLLEQLRTLDRSRLSAYMGNVGADKMRHQCTAKRHGKRSCYCRADDTGRQNAQRIGCRERNCTL